jgi:hypothetical protein
LFDVQDLLVTELTPRLFGHSGLPEYPTTVLETEVTTWGAYPT